MPLPTRIGRCWCTRGPVRQPYWKWLAVVVAVLVIAIVAFAVLLEDASDVPNQENTVTSSSPVDADPPAEDHKIAALSLYFLDEGDTAPLFSLMEATGREVELAQLIAKHEAVVIVFYRGYF
ncbi:MAG: hypothetical protein QGI09_06965 [Dehalococcoidia bacterium]|nr:hypothetical protein [Dehalococcoidia bacterium]